MDMTITIDESVAKDLIRSFGFEIDAQTGYIRHKNFGVQCAFCLATMHFSEFGGVVNYEGEYKLIHNRDEFI